MSIILDGTGLTIDKLTAIARSGEQVELHPAALERIRKCRAMLEKKIQAREIMYGVNTGIGEFSEIVRPVSARPCRLSRFGLPWPAGLTYTAMVIPAAGPRSP